MDFYEIRRPIRKVGKDKYIIGSSSTNPLINIDGSKLETYEIDVTKLNFDLADFNTISGNSTTSNTISSSTGTFDLTVSSSGDFLNINSNNLSSSTGFFDSIIIDGVDLNDKISQISQNQQTGVSGIGIDVDYRYELKEAFELDDQGDIVPTNEKYISDTMWILRNENDLELRANIWRHNTGPEAFTEDISF